MKKRIIILICALSIGLSSYSQTSDSTELDLKIDTALIYNTNFQIDSTFATSFDFKLPECPYTVENAIKDLKNDSMIIVIHGGFTGFGDIDEVRSQTFQKKYKVQFEYLGCIRSWDIEKEDTHGYNEIIFEYLTDKYGEVVHEEFKEIWN